MKAILVNEDKSLRWDEVPMAVCGEDDCLIKIEAAARNILFRFFNPFQRYNLDNRLSV